jgi:hypothetical protein
METQVTKKRIAPLEPDRFETLVINGSQSHGSIAEVGTYYLDKVLRVSAHDPTHSSYYGPNAKPKPDITVRNILANAAQVLGENRVSWTCPHPKTREEALIKLGGATTLTGRLKLYRGHHEYMAVALGGGWLYRVTQGFEVEVETQQGNYLKVTKLTSEEYKLEYPVGLKKRLNKWAFRYEGDKELIYAATSNFMGDSRGYGPGHPVWVEDGIVIMEQSNTCD